MVMWYYCFVEEIIEFVHSTKVNNVSVGDTVRAKCASGVKVHTCNYSHVAIVSFTKPSKEGFLLSKLK